MPAVSAGKLSFGEDADLFFFGVLSCCLCYYISCIMASENRSVFVWWHISAAIHLKTLATLSSAYRLYTSNNFKQGLSVSFFWGGLRVDIFRCVLL